jgi:hypothetical protein
LGERLKDWLAQLLKALSRGRGLGERKLKWRKSLFNPHIPTFSRWRRSKVTCVPQVADAPDMDGFMIIATLFLQDKLAAIHTITTLFKGINNAVFKKRISS